jgi:hypothetical protein
MTYKTYFWGSENSEYINLIITWSAKGSVPQMHASCAALLQLATRHPEQTLSSQNRVHSMGTFVLENYGYAQKPLGRPSTKPSKALHCSTLLSHLVIIKSAVPKPKKDIDFKIDRAAKDMKVLQKKSADGVDSRDKRHCTSQVALLRHHKQSCIFQHDWKLLIPNAALANSSHCARSEILICRQHIYVAARMFQQ